MRAGCVLRCSVHPPLLLLLLVNGAFFVFAMHNYQNIVGPMSCQTEWPHAVGLANYPR
jgi:hypothetical protein